MKRTATGLVLLAAGCLLGVFEPDSRGEPDASRAEARGWESRGGWLELDRRRVAVDETYADELKEHRAILQDHVRSTRDKFFGLGVRVDKRWRSHSPGYQNHQGLSAPEAAWEAEEKK